MNWVITYFNRSVFDDISAMHNTLRARYIALTERMEMHGPNLGMPHTRAFGDGLFELRIKGQEGIARVFYCVQIEREIVMLHSFIKKSQITPKKELDIAKRRLQEIHKHG